MSITCLVVLAAAVTASVHATAYEYPVNTSLLGRRHDGVGAISGGGATSRLLRDYPPDRLSDILDYLFLPSFGASLTILKIEIGGEVESTNGAEASHRRNASDLGTSRGYEWELMVAARARNPALQLYALAWGWPGYLRNGTNATNPFTDFALAADYLTSWLDIARHSYNLTIDFIGVWNGEGCAGCAFTAALNPRLCAEMFFGPYTFMPTLRAALDAAGHNSTKLVVADDYVNRWGIVDALTSNETQRAAVWGVGVHYPGAASPPEAQALGLPLWASEDDSDGGVNGGACLARAINENYVNGLSALELSVPCLAWFRAAELPAPIPPVSFFSVCDHNLAPCECLLRVGPLLRS